VAKSGKDETFRGGHESRGNKRPGSPIPIPGSHPTPTRDSHPTPIPGSPNPTLGNPNPIPDDPTHDNLIPTHGTTLYPDCYR
jgi:hypothetical protein